MGFCTHDAFHSVAGSPSGRQSAHGAFTAMREFVLRSLPPVKHVPERSPAARMKAGVRQNPTLFDPGCRPLHPLAKPVENRIRPISGPDNQTQNDQLTDTFPSCHVALLDPSYLSHLQ